MRLSSWRSERAARRDSASSRNTFGAGMRDAEGAGGELRPPPWRDKVDTHPRSAQTLEKPFGGALPLPSLWGDTRYDALQCRAAAQTLRPGRGAGGKMRWWALLALLALLPCASAPAALPCGKRAATPIMLTAASSAAAVVPCLLAFVMSAARAVQLFIFGALTLAGFLAVVGSSKPRAWLGPSCTILNRVHRLHQPFLTACLLCLLYGARAQDSRMYTRLACPTVKHRWVAAMQYLNATTWIDGVQSGAQDAVLVNSDTGTPAISKPFYDQSSKSVLFSPRAQSSTTGPYVNLQSVHFGTGDFTFVILAKYNSPGTSGDVWPRIFDFSTTGNQYGTYFILTEVRRRT